MVSSQSGAKLEYTFLVRVYYNSRSGANTKVFRVRDARSSVEALETALSNCPDCDVPHFMTVRLETKPGTVKDALPIREKKR